ncbi:hypothetical protein P4U99_06610 [Brevibacillus agri]|uniref:hypothetical protein n=1 Tax=Brevibacillus agri TaxID=51101 RepID=UPI002E251296|nr:hypothetical protein [Brevibacillus agri]MED1653688.1 hypothetical protein [Brevibacillus agri]MED1688643.1 hypothetical protein [Brevibacillus agri]MED1691042.1 hypothetical protein [Brevibacillus agri]MED1700215.1 hypothetical protein [Brevibacillus agri]
MQIVKEERGGALVIVFFIIVLFTVLALSLASYTMQSVKQRTFAEDEVQGKLLADAGLAYFQEYLETQLQMPHSFLNGNGTISEVRDSLSRPTEVPVTQSSDKVIDLVESISATEPNTYKEIRLPGMNGSFAIHTAIESRIPRDTGSTSQPYVLKLKVSVIGIPDRAENLRKVKLTSTVYVNTVPAPFHYAISTPGQLRLFGGSNVIGNIAADSVVTSSRYRYSSLKNTEDSDPANDEVVWEVGTSGPNYVEGEIFLPSRSRLMEIAAFPAEEPSSTAFSGPRIADLESAFVPSPLPDTEENAVTLSADPATPYIPGYEPPIVTERNRPTDSLFIDEQVGSTAKYVSDRIREGKALATSAQQMPPVESARWFRDPDEADGAVPPGFIDAYAPSGELLVIESPYRDANPDFLNLTARFTGDSLENIRHLYISGPDGEGMAAVEMGRSGSFKTQPDHEGKPFTYTGTIYIKGNLDIVGDVSINGTVYVDGNVVIREIQNITQPGRKNNLVIIASGTISLTDRYKDESSIDSKDIYPLSAFLYSESAMEIYSINSHNRLIGGIATGRSVRDAVEEGTSYIELNSVREDRAEKPPTHMSISFDRNIFEEKTPGLPPGDRFHIDMYDKEYPEVGDPILE